MRFNVDTHEVVVFTNKLEKINKRAFPSAVRGTLNSLAFDVKTTTMPVQAERAFVRRNKGFFKVHSRVQRVRSGDVNRMHSKVGFINPKKNQAVDNLEKQERGGVIKSREFIPTTASRTGKSNSRMVAKRNRLSNIDDNNNIVSISDFSGSSTRQKIIKASIKVGQGGFVQTENALLRVVFVKRNSRGNMSVKTEMAYSYKKGRSVRIKKPTRFMEKASNVTAKKTTKIYIKEAKRQFKKYL